MKRTLIVVVGASLLLAAHANAQDMRRGGMRGQRGEQRMRGPMQERGARERSPIDGIIQLRSELKLDDAQVEQLRTLARSQDERRAQREVEMRELRRRFDADSVDRDKIRTELRSWRDKLRDEMDADRDRLQKILTSEQRDRLQELRRERMREGMRSRSPQMRTERGFAPRMGRRLERGFAPGMDPRVMPRFRRDFDQ